MISGLRKRAIVAKCRTKSAAYGAASAISKWTQIFARASRTRLREVKSVGQSAQTGADPLHVRTGPRLAGSRRETPSTSAQSVATELPRASSGSAPGRQSWAQRLDLDESGGGDRGIDRRRDQLRDRASAKSLRGRGARARRDLRGLSEGACGEPSSNSTRRTSIAGRSVGRHGR